MFCRGVVSVVVWCVGASSCVVLLVCWVVDMVYGVSVWCLVRWYPLNGFKLLSHAPET